MVSEKVKNFAKETLHTLASSLLLTAFIYYFIATPNEVKGISMVPNVEHGDLILTNRVKHLLGGSILKNSWNYERGEMIIFKLPDRDAYIKRVVAIPGDKVQIIDESLIINDRKVIEGYIPEGRLTPPGDFIKEEPVYVPEDMYVALGDNRTNSLDSRFSSVGFVPRKYIIGPAAFRILPISEFGLIHVGEYIEENPTAVKGISDNIQIDIE